MVLTDSHAHLDMRRFDADRDLVIGRALSAGVKQIITIGIDTGSSLKGIALSKKYHCVFATAGIHPHNADKANHRDLSEIALLARQKKAVAIGEIGLDFYRNLSSRKKQRELFRQQLAIAQSHDLPVVIHDREAHEEVVEILSSFSGKGSTGVIHCFSGDYDLAESVLAMGYYISISGTVTLKNAAQTQQVAAGIPLDRMLLETDAPFLTPLPRRGQRNEPSFVVYTAQKVAELRGISLEEVAQHTSANTCRLFNLSLPPQ
jgi:TatD DNase family protein